MTACEARGAPELAAALRQCAARLEDMEPAHARAAAAIIDAASPPRRTGRLAASLRRMQGRGATVGSDVPYARPVEARTHFLGEAVRRSLPHVVGIYETHTADTVGSVSAA